MKLKITGRHINVFEATKEYAEKKTDRLEKYFNQIIDAHMILFHEKLDKYAELIINGDGVQFHGREKASEFNSAIDLLIDKMEKQIARYKDKISDKKSAGKENVMVFEVSNDSGSEYLLNQVSNKPIDPIEAYLQMKVNNQDFVLFKQGINKVDSDLDYLNKNYAVLFKDNDSYRMVELPFEKIKEHSVDDNSFIEYKLDVVEDSPTNPNIEFKKDEKSSINKFSLNEALEHIEKSGSQFSPFFNLDSQSLNVVYKNGKRYEIMVPAF